MEFDQAAWIAERGNIDGENRRAGMVPGLKDVGIIPGATRATIRELLGDPDTEAPANDVYYLGRAEYGVDLEQLRIRYDAEGRVSNIDIERS